MCEETTMRALWLLLGVLFLAGSGLGSRPASGSNRFHCKCYLLIIYMLIIFVILNTFEYMYLKKQYVYKIYL